MIRLTILAKVYCSEPGCSAYFKAEIPARVLPMTRNNEVELNFPLREVAIPYGWLKRHREAFCSKHNPERPLEEEKKEPKEEPTPEILERARALQALAIDKGAAEGERRNAWEQFGKLWTKYNLPDDIGLELEEIADEI